MSGLKLLGQVLCKARDKRLRKNWWQTIVNKLALISIETQTKLKFQNKKSLILNYTVSIISDEEIKELNYLHRKINKSTDVLSFPAFDASDFEISSLSNSAAPPEFFAQSKIDLAEIELGDIFICLNKVFAQAEEYGHSAEREAAFLFVHGFLHLLGYDHLTKNDEKAMFELQDTILEEAGLPRE